MTIDLSGEREKEPKPPEESTISLEVEAPTEGPIDLSHLRGEDVATAERLRGQETIPRDTSAFTAAAAESTQPPELFKAPPPNVGGVISKIPQAISAVETGYHQILVEAMDRPDLREDALTMDLKFWTPEAEEIRHAWPKPIEARRRMQAVKNVQEKYSDPTQVPETHIDMLEDREAREILYDIELQKIIQDENQTLLEFSTPAFEMQKLDFGSGIPPLWFPLARRSRTLAESEQQYLESRRDPITGQVDPQALAVVDKVRNLWEEHGLDPQGSDALDWEIKAGLPMVFADALTQMVLDPAVMLTGAGKPGGVPAKTIEDEFRRVGMIEALSKRTSKMADILVEQEGLATKATKQRAAAGVGKAKSQEQLARAMAEMDPELLENADKLVNVENDLIRSTRRVLDPHTIDDVMTDDIISIGYGPRKGGGQAKQIRELVKNRYPNIGPKATEEKVSELMHATKGLRAWNRVRRADEALKAADSMDARIHALTDLYLETGQQVKATKLAMVDELGKIAGGHYGKAGTEFKRAAKGLFIHPTNTDYVQELAGTIVTANKAQKKAFRHLTGFNFRGQNQEATRKLLGLWGFVARPLDVFEGTGVWEAMHRGWRAQRAADQAAVERVHSEFAHLVGTSRDYRNKLIMALDGAKVEALPDGGSRFIYTVTKSKPGSIPKRIPITLSATEMEDYTKLRRFFDDFADEATRAGLKGFTHGKPIFDYFPRIYDFMESTGGKVRYDIPVDLQDVVSSGIQFRHLHSRRWADSLLEEGALPDLLEVLPQYTRGMHRKLHLEPAIKEAEEAAKVLDENSRRVWKWWKAGLKGKPQGADAIMSGWKMRFGNKTFTPGTDIAFFASRMMYLGILGGNIGSALANFTQKINAAARVGPFHLMRGWTHYATPEGRAIARKLNLTDDFTNFFERPHPGLTRLSRMTGGKIKTWDEILMSPMHYAENHNRGVSFWAGASHEAEKHGVYNLKHLNKAPKEVQQKIIEAGLRVAEETQFIYGTMGTPPGINAMFGRKGGASVRTLTSFPPNQFAFLVRTLRDDPTGLLRFFAMSGLMTRMARDQLGIAAENIFGFGFVPPMREGQLVPGMPPILQPLVTLLETGMARDPFERRMAQERLFADLGNFIPVPVGLPKETTGARLDLGNRTYRNFMRMLRLAEEGVDRGYDESFRREVGGKELLARMVGLQPEAQRQFFQYQRDFMDIVKDGVFDLDSLMDQMAIAFVKGDSEKTKKLQRIGVQSGLLTEASLQDPSFMNRLLNRKILEQKIPFGKRAVMRRPELLLSPDIGGRMREYLKD